MRLIPAAHTLLLSLPLHVLLRHIYTFLPALPTPPRASPHTSLMAFLVSGIFSELPRSCFFPQCSLNVPLQWVGSFFRLPRYFFLPWNNTCGYKGGTLPDPPTNPICYQHPRYTSPLASLQQTPVCSINVLCQTRWPRGITSEALGKVLNDWLRIGGSALSPSTQRAGELCARVFELLLPDELPAVRAVGGLSQVGGHELVPVHLVHPPSHRPLPLPSEVLEDPVPWQSPCAGGAGEKRTTKH